MSSLGESYIDQPRKLAGERKLIVPAARAIIKDQQDKVLLVRRRDNHGSFDEQSQTANCCSHLFATLRFGPLTATMQHWIRRRKLRLGWEVP